MRNRQYAIRISEATMSKWLQATIIVLLIAAAILGGWAGYSLGVSAGKRAAVRQIQGEAEFIRQQAINGSTPAKAFCKAYRDLRVSLSDPLLQRAFQPLGRC
jgi:membrane protein YqaA with SNARE-associated domain